MKLDFNEANILIHTIEDLEKYKKPVNKTTIIAFLHELTRTTNTDNSFIVQSIASLSYKLELLSDNSISKIHLDAQNNKIVATARYMLPNVR